MINLSVDTRNLSHSLSEELLNEVFREMTFLVESSFDVSVEEIYGDVSYWTPTPDDEIEELELFGIIDIGDETTAFQKIVHLMAEHGYTIEMSEYQKEMKNAIKLYRWSENDRDVE